MRKRRRGEVGKRPQSYHQMSHYELYHCSRSITLHSTVPQNGRGCDFSQEGKIQYELWLNELKKTKWMMKKNRKWNIKVVEITLIQINTPYALFKSNGRSNKYPLSHKPTITSNHHHTINTIHIVRKRQIEKLDKRITAIIAYFIWCWEIPRTTNQPNACKKPTNNQSLNQVPNK